MKKLLILMMTIIAAVAMLAAGCGGGEKKTAEKEGYNSVVVAFEDQKESRLNKAQLGTYKKANVPAHRILRELRLDNAREFEIGKAITCDIFEENDKVDVTGLTRGRGFTGVIQRWNSARLRMTHGVSLVHRSVGSMGANSTPSRVMKGKKMPGHYGHETVTVQNLKVVRVDADRNIILVKGSIPGPNESIVTIKSAAKA